MKAAAVFSDNMVLQRGVPVRVFGTCEDVCGDIYVSVPEMGISAKASVNNGRWSALLPAASACRSCTLEITSDIRRIVFRNVAYGEVWLAGGQSNMQFELRNDKDGISALKNCHKENVRYYNTPKCSYFGEDMKRAESRSCWTLPSEEGSGEWSAAGYYFAAELSRRLGVTVGIIGCNWGGTSASAWVSEDVLSRDSRLAVYLDDYDKAVEGKSEEQMTAEYLEYTATRNKWIEKVVACMNEKGLRWGEASALCGEDPYPGPMGHLHPERPCGLYSTMLCRIAPYTVRGVLWYQGESDDRHPEVYYTLITSLIGLWRTMWHNDSLPFIIAQLPVYGEEGHETDTSWSLIREAQMKVYETVRNTGLAVLLDCGEFGNIHPIDKAPVGHRMYLQALSEVYSLADRKDTLPPVYSHVECGEDELRVYFDNMYGVRTETGWASGFAIADAEGEFFPADEAEFDGCGVLHLKSRFVEYPVRVRYLWNNYAEVKLFGVNGLPIPPFRS